MNIAILTPSRGRPGRLDNFIESVYNTAANPDRVFCYNYIDNDDPRIRAYDDYSKKQSKNSTIIFGEPISVSMSWNIIAGAAMTFRETPADILIMGNDDLLYRTKGWDLVLDSIVPEYADDIYCMWFEDKINGPDHCAFPIVSRKWYETLGYFTPGIFNFGYNDTWIHDIAKRINRVRFIPEVVNEHMHFTTGKSELDDTYHRNRTQERGNLYDLDKILFENSADRREVDAEKLRKIML